MRTTCDAGRPRPSAGDRLRGMSRRTPASPFGFCNHASARASPPSRKRPVDKQMPGICKASFSFDRRLFAWVQWFASKSHFQEAAAMFARLGWAQCVFMPSVLMLLVVGARAETPATPDEDPLPIESQWKGKLAQLGIHPTTQF